MSDQTGNGWHVSGAVLARYARGEATRVETLSADAHLASCASCRSRLAEHVDSGRLDAIWSAVAASTVAQRPATATWRLPLERLAPIVALPLAMIVLVAGIGRIVTNGGDDAPAPIVALESPAPPTELEPTPSAAVRWPEPSGDTPAAPPPAPPPAAEAEVLAAPFALETFDACDDLGERLAATAIEHVTPYGLTRGRDAMLTGGDTAGGTTGGGTTGAAPPPAQAPQPDSAPRDAASPGFSGTNVQEAGVDEPDHVKTDGRFAYVLTGDALVIVSVGESPPRVVSRWQPLHPGASQLLLAGDRLMVISHDQLVFEHSGGGVGMHPVTYLTLMDVTDRAQPAIVGEVELDGAYVNARLVDQYARVVIRTEPWQLDLVSPTGDRTADEALAHNRAVVGSAPPQQWLPLVRVGVEGERSAGRPLLGCGDAHVPVEFAGFGSISVVSLDLGGTFDEVHAASVQASGETVYADADTLYVATNRWVDPTADVPAEIYTTEIHAFDISDPFTASYLASGRVEGHLLNQFSLSEHAGHLRVATTEGPPWTEGTESAVRVLAQRGTALEVVGEVGGLGKGERIFAVRYVGDTGYVVTFRQIDPLYTLDLSDPAAPRVVGELKIPGFSAYLHPVGPGRLLGLGQDADESGLTSGAQLSLFDVSDPAAPARLDSERLGDWSQADHDHHAFLYWPATGLVMVPVTADSYDADTGESRHWTGAVGYALAGDDLVRLAEVAHPSDQWGMQPPIARSFVVGGTVFTVSAAGMLASDIDTLAERGWLAWS